MDSKEFLNTSKKNLNLDSQEFTETSEIFAFSQNFDNKMFQTLTLNKKIIICSNKITDAVQVYCFLYVLKFLDWWSFG